MIRTPLGQWINENYISNAWIDNDRNYKEDTSDGYKYRLDYYIRIKLLSEHDTVIASSFYDTKEEAQSKLDRMFAANRCK